MFALRLGQNEVVYNVVKALPRTNSRSDRTKVSMTHSKVL